MAVSNDYANKLAALQAAASNVVPPQIWSVAPGTPVDTYLRQGDTSVRVQKIRNGYIVYIDGGGPHEGTFASTPADVSTIIAGAIGAKDLE